ncbi:MAG: hypothetical protein JJU10_05415 [Idiomarina sp.]|nr:hypothetical protein [Idiomarina sp.]
MELSEHVPERRNLTVISLAFIAYYFGGGELVGDKLHLGVVSAEFSNAKFLAIMAWIIFGWTIWRFWVVTRNQLIVSLNRELKDEFFFNKYLAIAEELISKSDDSNTAPQKISVTGVRVARFMINIDVSLSLKHGAGFHVSNLGEQHKLLHYDCYITRGTSALTISFRSPLWFKYSLPTLIRLVTCYPTTASIFAPYTLAGLALLGGLLSLIN